MAGCGLGQALGRMHKDQGPLVPGGVRSSVDTFMTSSAQGILCQLIRDLRWVTRECRGLAPWRLFLQERPHRCMQSHKPELLPSHSKLGVLQTVYEVFELLSR